MDLIYLLLGIAIIGLLVYLIITYIPMPPAFKTLIEIVTIVAIILYLIARFAKTVPNLL